MKEVLDIKFLEEFLHTYDFEKTDFVYEAGQFAIRGGIIDIFSFAYEYPYRIELFGDEVDSIRTFDPGSQLSVENLDTVNIIPNIQSKLTHDERQSFFEFIPEKCVLSFKDYQLTQDVVQKSFEKAEESFKKIIQSSEPSGYRQRLFNKVSSCSHKHMLNEFLLAQIFSNEPCDLNIYSNKLLHYRSKLNQYRKKEVTGKQS